MGAVALVAGGQLARRWRGLLAAGILLGLGFGVCLASLAAARKTATAYDRILVAADAPDAAVAHGSPLDEAEQSLRTIDGITAQRVYAGFRGSAEGVDPVLTSGLLAPARGGFPLELPVLSAGRLPDPEAPDEVFVSETVAKGAGLEVGRRLTFHLFRQGFARSVETPVTIVGIGTIPAEAVSDETTIFGVVVFTRAFYDAHRDLTAYSVSNVDLAPGFDARRDLGAAVGALGHDVQSIRDQETDSINEALRPLVIVLVALGLVAFGVTAVAAGQVIQRNRDRGSADSLNLRRIGMTRSQARLVGLAVSATMASVMVGTALGVMLVASPLAPIGPLRTLDPAQGVSIDTIVASGGAAAIVLTILLLTIGTSAERRHAARPSTVRRSWLAYTACGPATVAGLTLALRSGSGRGAASRSLATTTGVAVLLSLCATFVLSAVTLSETPSRYGFDADLIALNAYGDQSAHALERAFGETEDVVAATGFTLVPLLLDHHAVPGLAATVVKGDLTPTILEGRPARSEEEIVVGTDTLERLGAAIGDVVRAQLSTASGGGGQAARDPTALEIVGVATFPPVSQVGTDVPRLGTGALITREAFLGLGGDQRNEPEFTTVRVVEGTDPSDVIARLPNGFQDLARTNTTWFTGTKPAEIRQLDAAMPYLRGSLAVAYAVLLAAIAHALWTRARAHRHALAVLRAVGCTARQLGVIVAWQALPIALAATLIGIPIGIALGRWSFTHFARSLAVIDNPSTTVAMVGVLVLATMVATVIADLASVLVARRSSAAVALREG